MKIEDMPDYWTDDQKKMVAAEPHNWAKSKKTGEPHDIRNIVGHQWKNGNPGGPGRGKGSKNKMTLRQELIEKDGITPAQFLASVVNDENANMNQRIRAAEASAKFYDPTLSSVEVHTDEDHVAPFNIILASNKPIDDQLDEVIEHLEDGITKD